MALQKDIMTSYGVNTDYHKIGITNINWHSKTAKFHVLSYIDKDARDNNMAYLDFSYYEFSGDDFDFNVDENIVRQGYEKLKGLLVFAESEDV